MMLRGFLLFELMIILLMMTMIGMAGCAVYTSWNHLIVRQELDRLQTLFFAYSAQAVRLQKSISCSLADIALAPGVCFGPDCTFSQREVIFYPDGKIKPGTLYLTDTQHKWWYALTCQVGEISYLRRYRQEGTKWVCFA